MEKATAHVIHVYKVLHVYQLVLNIAIEVYTKLVGWNQNESHCTAHFNIQGTRSKEFHYTKYTVETKCILKNHTL